MRKASSIVLTYATISVGLMAGLFFAFDVAFMPGLKRGDDRTFVLAMQNVNVAIENPVFFLAFFGGLFASGIAVFLEWRGGRRTASWWVLAGLICYALSMILTIGVNLPINDELAEAKNPAEFSAARDEFLDGGVWLISNAFRTLSCIAGLCCLIRGWVLRSRPHTHSQEA